MANLIFWGIFALPDVVVDRDGRVGEVVGGLHQHGVVDGRRLVLSLPVVAFAGEMMELFIANVVAAQMSEYPKFSLSLSTTFPSSHSISKEITAKNEWKMEEHNVLLLLCVSDGKIGREE